MKNSKQRTSTHAFLVGFVALAFAACKETVVEPGPPPVAGPVPAAPGAVAVMPMSDRIDVSWSDQSSDETTFVVGRVELASASLRPMPAELRIIGSVGAGVTSFVDTDVDVGRIYFYGVAARSDQGTSAFTLQTGQGVSLTLMGSTCGGPRTATDADGDTLSDTMETEGWTVLVDEDGRGALTMRPVKSSPFEADTDGDGLCDNEESQLRIDPRRADTDGDGLGDLEEVNRWGSSPTNVDSDGDSTGNSSFYDGSELFNFGTSPTLADSDGDGRTDFEEINQNGTNALSAELPQPKIELVGKMDLSVNVTTTDGTVITDAATNAFERSTSNSLENTSETANTTSVESSYTLSTEATVGFPASAGVSVSGSYSEKVGYVEETSSSWSKESRKTAQESYERLTSNAISEEQEITDGELAITLEIFNQGTRTFEISGLIVTALQRSPSNPTTFTSIASLDLPAEADGIVLGEGDRRGPFRAEATIPANVALDLLANPGTVFFRAASFNLTDRGGENFEFTIGEETNNRTALLTIDYGGLRPLERYRIATNVERAPDGRAAGVRLGDALNRILGLSPGVGYRMSPKAGGVKVLDRVRDVESIPRPGGGAERFWALIAAPNPDVNLGPVSDRLLSSTIDFDQLQLMPKDALTLAYVADRDGDGLFEREERMYGTFDELVDSDGDGLTDFEEARAGWDVLVDVPFYLAHPRVFSNPALTDADEDGWEDPVELTMGTDPNRKDTDNDGLLDPLDPEPRLGPRGTWVSVIGTTSVDTIRQVLTSSGSIYVLGDSAGDIDADATPGGPFIMSIEADTGAVRWTVQIENVVDTTTQMAVDAAGTVTYFAEIGAGGLPGIGGLSTYAIQIERDGTLRPPIDWNNTPYNDAYRTDLIRPWVLVGFANGTSMLLSQRTQLNGGFAIDALGVDAAGGYLGATGYGISNPIVEIKSGVASGRLGAAVLDYGASGCEVGFLLPPGGMQNRIPFCNVARPARVERVALDSFNAIYVSSNSGGNDRFERLDLTGTPIWERNFLPEIEGPSITSIDVDSADQIYVGLQDLSTLSTGEAALDVRQTDGTRSYLLRFGNSTTVVHDAVRDRIGNLYLGVSTAGGFEAYGASIGNGDLVLVRNPQLVFAP